MKNILNRGTELTPILHVLAQRPDQTGSGIYLRNIVTLAHQKGYVQGIVVGIPADSPDDLAFLPPEVARYPVYFESSRLPFPVVGMSDQMPYRSTKYRDLDDRKYRKWLDNFSEVIYEAVHGLRPDVILSHHLWLLTSFVAKTFPDIPVLGISHGTGLRQFRNVPSFRSPVLAGCRKLTGLLALHEQQKTEISQLYGIPIDTITVVGNGYNEQYFYPGHTERSDAIIRIVFTGKLSYAKGVPQLLEAFIALNEQLIDISLELHVCGSGQGIEADKIIKRATRQKYSETIFLHGIVSQPELGDLYRQSDIFVLPSFYEGLPLVLIEAMACGLRLVSTELPGSKELFRELTKRSDYIQFVPLPTLEDVDKPVAGELPAFVASLRMSLLFQIRKIMDNSRPDMTILTPFLKNKSWKGTFNKIERLMDGILKK